jgi:hypothetical protein
MKIKLGKAEVKKLYISTIFFDRVVVKVRHDKRIIKYTKALLKKKLQKHLNVLKLNGGTHILKSHNLGIIIGII